MGNILVCDDGTTTLVDCEYAKQRDNSDRRRPERIVSSIYDVVYDISNCIHMGHGELSGCGSRRGGLFVPGLTPRIVDEVIDDQPAADEVLEPLPAGGGDDAEHAADNVDEPQTSQKPFRHNPLRDLESLKWVGIHLITGRRIISVGGGNKRPNVDDYSHLDEQHRRALKLSYNSRERNETFDEPKPILGLNPDPGSSGPTSRTFSQEDICSTCGSIRTHRERRWIHRFFGRRQPVCVLQIYH